MQPQSILKTFYHSFGFKLFLYIGVALIILMGFDTWYTIHMQEQHLNEDILMAMNNITRTVQYATRIQMLENKKEDVQDTITHISKNTKGIERIRIFNKKGEITHSTVSEEKGRFRDKTARQCSVCHAGGDPFKKLDEERHTSIIPSETGEYRVVSLTYPIYNEPDCYTRCHESHPRTKTLLGIFEVTMSLKDVDEMIAQNRRHFILISTISFILIMAGLGLILFYSLVRPMNTLLTGIKNISQGIFTSDIPVYRKDEFARLAQSLNKMLEKLRKEVAYRNLLLYDDHLPEKMEEEEDTPQTRQEKPPEVYGKDTISPTFEEIYDRLRDETHMKLVRSVKLASLGQLSAGIAHEVNNPLTAVLSYSSLLLEKAKGEKEKKWLNIIVDETKRCRNIVAGLLEFARQSTPEKVTTQVNDIVERAVSLVETKESFHNIKIVKKLDPDLPRVRVDRGQIYQVLTNLIINAGDAMHGKGTLTVESQIYTAESKVADDHHFVEVSVRDTGCGIPEVNMERLFDPFFTTKGPTVGTGLGLSICFGIIKRHGGNITVQSKVNEGSTFVIHLPIEMENENE